MSVFFRSLMLGALLVLACAGPRAQAAQQCLVIGDSLTKEYEVEFPALFPTSPASWSSRNWIEILHERRRDWFDLGRFSGFVDPRLTGHEHNWAFPGATTTEIRTQLNRWQNLWWTVELQGQLRNAVERVVIFAGGNDVDSYYRQIYNGGSATAHINATRDNLKWIVNYVRDIKPSLPIVLVSVPHLGCAPDVQRQCPTDAVKTGRVTAALDSLNAQLATFATSKGIGFEPGVYAFTKALISEPFVMAGLEFYKQADMDSRPRYVFSGDGFHPATSAQAKIAQMVIEAFVKKYPTRVIPAMTDVEIVRDILGLQPVLPFETWIAGQSVPAGQRGPLDDPDGDGLSNAVEFLLDGAQPMQPTPGLLSPQVEWAGGQKFFQWTYKLRPEAQAGVAVVPQLSTDLKNWSDASSTFVTTDDQGRVTVRVPTTTIAGRRFLRLRAQF